MTNSTLTRKGQTTIPREVREALGLRPGMRLVFEISGGAAVIRPQPGAMTAFGALGGPSVSAGTGAEFEDARAAALEAWAKEAAEEGGE